MTARHGSVVVGLVNAMPGEAYAYTERRFRALLAAAAPEARIEVVCARLDDTRAVRAARLDGLIVTGMPPTTAVLQDEPSWPALTDLVDHASDNAIPAMWLCLAAHAAVLHLDGIERRPLPAKCAGLFQVARAPGWHKLTAGLPRGWRVPHSRHNDLPGDRLVAAGYRILSSSAEAGVDMFTKQCGARFVFCQGHPEYEAQTLLREYRRDVAAFLAGDAKDYPAVPRHCFTVATLTRLNEFRAEAERARAPGLLDAFPTRACTSELRESWSGVAQRLYANWLSDIAARPRGAAAARGTLRAEAAAWRN